MTEIYTALKEASETEEIFHSPLIYGCNDSDILCVMEPEDVDFFSVTRENELNDLTKIQDYKWAIFAVENDSVINGIILDIVKEHYNLITNGSLLYCSTNKDKNGYPKCSYGSISEAKNITVVYSSLCDIGCVNDRCELNHHTGTNDSSGSASTNTIIYLQCLLSCALVFALYLSLCVIPL